jgi:histidine phosphotransferase ChpT
MLTDIHILELLASKICHDLVSPVGAINNGVELIEEIGGGVVDEAMRLISSSAEQAAWRLKLFRLAYGRAGADASVSFKEMQEIITAHFAHTKIALHWAPDCPTPAFIATRGALKIMLNVLLLAEEALIYGGDIHCEPGGGTLLGGVTMRAVGRNANLPAATQQALRGEMPAEQIAARTVHAHVTGLFLGLYGFTVLLDATQPETLALHLAPA